MHLLRREWAKAILLASHVASSPIDLLLALGSLAQLCSVLIIHILPQLLEHQVSLHPLNRLVGVLNLLRDVLLTRFRLLLHHDEQPDLLIKTRHVHTGLVQEQKLVVELMLVLLLVLLPLVHLVLQPLGGCIDPFLQDTTTRLDLGHFSVQLSLNLEHLLDDDVLDVLLVEAFLLGGLLVVRVVVEVVVGVFKKRLLHIDFEPHTLRHGIVDLYNFFKDRAATNISQNLLLHLHRVASFRLV